MNKEHYSTSATINHTDSQLVFLIGYLGYAHLNVHCFALHRTGMIELGLIEDNWFIRSNYEDFFRNDPDFKILFSADDINGLQTISNSLQPSIILLDLLLPSGNSMRHIHK
ncbi:MAG: hypothetical protein EOO85_26340, partial [Pedobacter sp.]